MNKVFKAWSDPTRRQVLQLLRKRPMTAGELSGHFAVSKPTMSGHFAVLKEAGLIDAEKTGTTITYRSKMSVLEEALLELAQAFGMEMKSGAANEPPARCAQEGDAMITTRQELTGTLTGLCILIAPICGGLFYRGQLSIKEWLVMSGLMGRCFPARRRGVGLEGGMPSQGMGDIVSSFFISASRPGSFIWGAGPAFLLSTNSDPVLGSSKWAAAHLRHRRVGRTDDRHRRTLQDAGR